MHPLPIKQLLKLCLVFVWGLHAEYSKAECCNYVLFMSDNYGDGWQGAVLEVFINNISVGTYSAVNSGNSINFSICDGDELVLSYSSGDWENENAYTLFDASWNAIFQDGPFPDTGLVFSSVGNCSAPIRQGGHPCTALVLQTRQRVTGSIWMSNHL